MASNFNTYYGNIDSDFWRNLCVEKGVLRQYDKGELTYLRTIHPFGWENCRNDIYAICNFIIHRPLGQIKYSLI